MRTPLVYTLEGIVLKRRNMGESDRLVTLFTKQKGKIRVLARGVRRIGSRRAGHLEVFGRVSVTIHKGREMDTLSEATSFGDKEQWGILTKIAGAYYICELVDTLLPIEQEHADVYELLLDTLKNLHHGPEKQEDVLARFSNSLLWSLGFLPRSRILTPGTVAGYIESLIEKRLRSKQLLTTLG